MTEKTIDGLLSDAELNNGYWSSFVSTYDTLNSVISDRNIQNIVSSLLDQNKKLIEAVRILNKEVERLDADKEK
jgi:hypothetical protein